MYAENAATFAVYVTEHEHLVLVDDGSSIVCVLVPQLIRFFESSNLVVRGLRVENSPEFHFRFDGCSDVLVDGLFIRSPANSPNTDGIHVENTERVGIYNSKISNGTTHATQLLLFLLVAHLLTLLCVCVCVCDVKASN